MDWNLFWNAFGAIGTTVGSITTACAVVIAIKQYKQPLEKQVEVNMTFAGTKNYADVMLIVHCINVKNKGIREVNISSVSILMRNNKKLVLNGAQDKLEGIVKLPTIIKPEEYVEFFFCVEDFKLLLNSSVQQKLIKRTDELIICVTDSLGDEYLCKTNIKINSLIRNNK